MYVFPATAGGSQFNDARTDNAGAAERLPSGDCHFDDSAAGAGFSTGHYTNRGRAMIQRIRLRAQQLERLERRGSILLIVLVIIVLLALGAYTFTEMSVAENEATTMYGRSVMARGFAESGIDLAANALSDPAQREQADPVLNQPGLFSA